MQSQKPRQPPHEMYIRIINNDYLNYKSGLIYGSKLLHKTVCPSLGQSVRPGCNHSSILAYKSAI